MLLKEDSQENYPRMTGKNDEKLGKIKLNDKMTESIMHSERRKWINSNSIKIVSIVNVNRQKNALLITYKGRNNN